MNKLLNCVMVLVGFCVMIVMPLTCSFVMLGNKEYQEWSRGHSRRATIEVNGQNIIHTKSDGQYFRGVIKTTVPIDSIESVSFNISHFWYGVSLIHKDRTVTTLDYISMEDLVPVLQSEQGKHILIK